MRWSYLPPLMVYFAAGISGFTGIIESFFVKEALGLSAGFLAGLGFWAGLPWALKMPLGHLVDLLWHRKSLFVYLGATLMSASLLIMVGLTGYTAWMKELLRVDTWYVIAVMLAPIGFVLQDVVADAMTVEAVPVTMTTVPGYLKKNCSRCTLPCRPWDASPSLPVGPRWPVSAAGLRPCYPMRPCI